MEKKSIKMIVTVALIISLIGNVALFWQLKEEQTTYHQKTEEIAQNASEKVKKNSSKGEAEISELKQTIQEKENEIAQLKDQDGAQSTEQSTQLQKKTAEDFAKIAIDKSIGADEIANQLKGIASQEVIDKLDPADVDQADNDYDSYSFTLEEPQSYVESSTGEDTQNLVVFLDYSVSNPQFKDVKPQKIKGGLTVTEKQVNGQWQVTDFNYFTR